MLRDYTMFIEKLAQQPSGQASATPPWYFLQMADALNERQFLSITDADSTVEGGYYYFTFSPYYIIGP